MTNITTTDDFDDTKSENTTTNLDVKIVKENGVPFEERESEFPTDSIYGNTTSFKLEQRYIEEALEYGFKAAKELYEIKEPLWYNMGELQKRK